jgi:hypothetical protein
MTMVSTLSAENELVATHGVTQSQLHSAHVFFGKLEPDGMIKP